MILIMPWLSRFSLWFFYVFQLSIGCKEMTFKINLGGQALVNHTFLATQATDDGHCEAICFLDDRCISFNFGRGESGEHYICELNEADHKMFPDDLLPRSDTIYRMAETTCNCSKNEICRPDFESQTHRCICNHGYTLENCRTSFQVTNCNGYTDQRINVFELDGSGASQVKFSICRVILNANADTLPTQPYRLTVDLYSRRPDNSNVTHPGIGFNVVNQDNFDYILFRTHSNITCVMIGKLRNNTGNNIRQTCKIDPPPAYAWFQVAVEVRQKYAKVFVDGNFAEQFTPTFSLRQRGAVATVNGYKNLVLFRNFKITQLN